MKWNISDLPVFTSVVEQGGISNAARALRLPKSSVSRFIARLESDLNLRLFERNSRQMRMTQEGELFYKHCQLIMEQIEAADAHMNGLTATPSGELHVSLPMAFSRFVVSKHLPGFHQRHPEINLQISINPKPVDLIGDHIDVAVMVGDLPDSDYVAVPLIETPLLWITHRNNLHRYEHIRTAEALQSAVVFSEVRYNRTPIKVKIDGKQATVTVNASIETTDPIMVKDAIMLGEGVGLLPELYCREELKSGALVRVASGIQPISNARSSAVYTSKRMLNARTRVFIDFLKEVCQTVNHH